MTVGESDVIDAPKVVKSNSRFSLGHITLKELLDMMEYFKFKEESISDAKATFEKSDVSEDQKLSLAGAIAHFSLFL